jgi:hypothetical protein
MEASVGARIFRFRKGAGIDIIGGVGSRRRARRRRLPRRDARRHRRQPVAPCDDPSRLASIAAVVLGGASIVGGSGTYAGTIPGAVLLVTITALITVVNASAGWRSILFGSLILALLLLSGRESRRR